MTKLPLETQLVSAQSDAVQVQDDILGFHSGQQPVSLHRTKAAITEETVGFCRARFPTLKSSLDPDMDLLTPIGIA